MSIAGLTLADYDVAPGQTRFVMSPSAEQTGNSETELVTVITNWFERLRTTVARMP